MSRFTFILRSGNGDTDVEEVDLADAYAARREALHACGDFLREMDGAVVPSDAWEMEVTDANGKCVCVLRFSSETYLTEARAHNGRRN